MIRSIVSISRVLRSTHPVFRSVIGLALGVLAIAWLRRDYVTSDPLMFRINIAIGVGALALAVVLAIPGLLIIDRWIRKGSGPPSSIEKDKAHGEATDATLEKAQEILEKRRASPRPQFLK